MGLYDAEGRFPLFFSQQNIPESACLKKEGFFYFTKKQEERFDFLERNGILELSVKRNYGGYDRMKKWVYLFTEGNATMRNLLGGKGANLAEMTNLGLPVPQGFTITTEACTQYYEDNRQINDEIMDQIMEHISKMEDITGKIRR